MLIYISYNSNSLLYVTHLLCSLQLRMRMIMHSFHGFQQPMLVCATLHNPYKCQRRYISLATLFVAIIHKSSPCALVHSIYKSNNLIFLPSKLEKRN